MTEIDKKIYIINALRTAIGNFGGSLSEIPAVKLGSLLIKDILKGYSSIAIDGVIIGMVLQAGAGQNPARQCALNAGLSFNTPCFTVNKVCGSSMKAAELAYNYIKLGKGDVFFAGGIENMSLSPYILNNSRWGIKLGNSQVIDELIIDGLWCPFNNVHMGKLIEDLAKKNGITRKMQDSFSCESNLKAVRATKEKKFDEEIVKVEYFNKKENKNNFFSIDERPREDTSIEKLSKLNPVFAADGTITAGNASGINDGAAMLLLASEKAVEKFNFKPMAEILGFSEVSIDPKDFGIAPIYAIKNLLKEFSIGIEGIDLFEINEAFAAQALCVIINLGIDYEKVNVNGGAVALGHPIGATGARIIVTLVHEMIRRKSNLGIASLCIGSGEAMAVLVKNCSNLK